MWKVDCKTVGFFSKSVKKSVKRNFWVLRARSSRASHPRRARSVSPQSRSLFSASFQTFRLTALAYLNTQKYGLFCSLCEKLKLLHPLVPPSPSQVQYCDWECLRSLSIKMWSRGGRGGVALPEVQPLSLLYRFWQKSWMPISFRVFSLTWPASTQIYWNKRKGLHNKRVQLPEDWFGTPTWPPFHCFGTPIWPPWRHVKTLYTFYWEMVPLLNTQFSTLHPFLTQM